MLISLCFVAVYTSYAPRMNHIKLLARIHGYPVIHLSQRKPKRVTNGDLEDSTVISPVNLCRNNENGGFLCISTGFLILLYCYSRFEHTTSFLSPAADGN
ncbi:hypothetical protein YC2023_004873 [Brassica napus]